MNPDPIHTLAADILGHEPDEIEVETVRSALHHVAATSPAMAKGTQVGPDYAVWPWTDADTDAAGVSEKDIEELRK